MHQPTDSAQPSLYLFEQRPPPKYGSTMQPPQPDGHLVAMPQEVVVHDARSPRIGSASRTAFYGFVNCLLGTTGVVVLRFVMMDTSMLAAAPLAGRAIGPAIATAANSIAVRMVSCMAIAVGFGRRGSFGGFFERLTERCV